MAQLPDQNVIALPQPRSAAVAGKRR